MFCYHCQEAKKNIACDTVGICGKQEDVSSLQDLLVYALKGLAFYAHKAGQLELHDAKTDRFAAQALYSTVTNVNFDPAVFVSLIRETVQRRNHLRQLFTDAFLQKNGFAFDAPLPEAATWQYAEAREAAFAQKGETVGVMQNPDLDPDRRGLRELLVYGVKGLAALVEHAAVLGFSNAAGRAFIYEALAFSLNDNNSIDDLLVMNLKCGEYGMTAMALLDEANTAKFGHPSPAKVHFDVWNKPGILVSGHDLQDIEDLLVQTAGTGVDVYTHGEVIAAHAYPALSKYFNLVGHFGGAWQEQRTEFAKFNGPILVTTNSIQQPKDSYKGKLYTTGMTGWPDVSHIEDRKPGQRKNFRVIIEQARQCQPPSPIGEGSAMAGYAHHYLMDFIDKFVVGIQSGDIKRIIVMAGGDGRHKERKYYTQVAEALPKDAIILTAGDTKFRFHTLNLGEINGIPRLLDAGQSNDFYSLIVFLQKLQKALGADTLNAMPVSFNLAWYEQRTIVLLLALLAMNVKNVRFGPTFPAFFSANIKELFADRFSLKVIDSAENDVAAMMAGN